MSKLEELKSKLAKAKTNKLLPDNLREKIIAKIEKEIAEHEKPATKGKAKGLKIQAEVFEAPYNVSDGDRKEVERLSQEQLDFFNKWRETEKIDCKKVDNYFTVAYMMRVIGPVGVSTNSFPALFNYFSAVDKLAKGGAKAGKKAETKNTDFNPDTDDWKDFLKKQLDAAFGKDKRETNSEWDVDYYYTLKYEGNTHTILYVADGSVYISEITPNKEESNDWNELHSLQDEDAAELAKFIAKALKMSSKKSGAKPEKDKAEKKTYKGKNLGDLDDKDCDELLAEVAERRAAAKKSAKKSEKKPVIEKVSAPIVRGVEKAIKNIESDDLSAKKIKQVKDAIEATKSFIQSLKTLLGEDYDAQAVTDEIKPLLELAKKIEEKFLKTEK